MVQCLLYIMNDIESKIQSVLDWLTSEYTGIRTGQATPALLDSVKIESYGTMMPLNQVASIGIEDARTLRISPWDSSLVKTLENTIRDADLGVSVIADSSGVRVVFPELTGDRRVQLLKLAKSKLEDARVSVRAIRDEVMKGLEKQQKDGDISEDEKFAKKEDVQKKVDAINRTLDSIYEKKEQEIHK